MSDEPIWHYMDWDETKIAKFWSFASSWPSWQDDYFSKQVGKGIVNFLRYVLPVQDRILDFGCGPGYLVENMLAAGISCEALDSSAETVSTINKRFAADSLWGGAKLFSGDEAPYPDDTFALIICLETIEHILPAKMGIVLNELHRILKPQNGKLFITTPNAENLEKSYIYCPECGSVLHRYQHISSFTQSSLEALLSAHGFRTTLCNVTNFHSFQEPLLPGWYDWNLSSIVRCLKYTYAGVLDFLKMPGAPIGGRRFHQRIGSGYHLFWLGTKE